MRDALHDFGAIALAVKDTDVFSADSLDWEGLDARYRLSKHATGMVDDLAVVFNAGADFGSIDGMIPFIQDSPDGSTDWQKILIGSEVTAPKKGVAVVLPVPKLHRKVLRAGCTPKSSGTFTAKSVKSYIEFGANLP